ncbi:MAG: hypothetical protein CMH52_07910 [Myxococcales bacterium]|nr:hypothetical protein [Myxococcales bacterium]
MVLRPMLKHSRNFASFILSLGLALNCLTVGCGAGPEAKRKIKETAQYHYNLAHGYYFNSRRANNVDGAMQEVLKSLKADPNYAEAHMLAGMIYMGREIHVKAIRHFKKAIALKPNYYKAANNLGAAYLHLGRWDDAIKVYESLVSNIMYVTPGHGHNNLGWAWYKRGNLDKASRHFRMAINLAPQLCVAQNNLGLVMLKQKNLRRAVKYLRRAIKKCPNYAEPYYHLGRTQSDAQNFTDARSNFERCVKLAGDSKWGDRCDQRLSTLPRGGGME